MDPFDRLTPRELRDRLRAGAAPAILDVRTRAEYLAGHVPGARHVPFWAILFSRRRLPAARDEPLVVYCGQGPRAQLACAGLRLLGFTRLVDLDGHWEGWVQAGGEVETERAGTGTRPS